MLDFIGWVGAAIGILAQLLVSLGKTSPVGPLFASLSWMSFSGIALVGFYHNNYQPVLLSFFFCLVVSVGVIRTYIRNRREIKDHRRCVTMANDIATNTLDGWRRKGILPTRN